MRERLTNKVSDNLNNITHYNCKAICSKQKSFLNKDCLAKNCGECEHFLKIINRLGELEDKIENGTLMESPCKVGDEIYFVNDYYGRIFKGKVEFFTCSEEIDYIYAQYPETTIKAHEVADIGNEVFFTRAEAEKKLKELKGEK